MKSIPSQPREFLRRREGADTRLVTLLLGVASLAVVGAQAQPAFKTQTRLVVLQVTVLNRHGDLVTNLPREAFTVREDGKPQTIALFGRDDVPVSVGILIDNSGSMRTKRQTVESAALAFVRASNPQDEVFVMNFADEPHLDVPFTRSIQQLEAGISGIEPVGGTAMRDAVAAGLDYLAAHATRERRALLVVTDGLDNSSAAGIDSIGQRVEESEAVVFAVGVLADEPGPKASKARSELENYAHMTGGRAFFPARVDDVNATVLEIARQLRSQYTIAYTPANQALDGSYRRIQVGASGAERLIVRTRAGYLASREGVTPPRPPVRRR